MIVIESKDGKFKVKSTRKSNGPKSNDEVEEFSERARTSPTVEEIELSKQVGFKESIFGKEVTIQGKAFFVTNIRPKNKKPIVFQEKGKWYSYVYLHPAGVKAHIPELAKLMV